MQVIVSLGGIFWSIDRALPPINNELQRESILPRPALTFEGCVPVTAVLLPMPDSKSLSVDEPTHLLGVARLPTNP